MRQDPFFQAAQVLPECLRHAAQKVDKEVRDRVEEFRLRQGAPMTVLLAEGERPLEGAAVTEDDLRAVVEQASGASAHTVLGQVRSGFVTIPGGHRIGLCGEAVMRDGHIHALSHLSSLAIRIARPIPGVGGQVLPDLMEGDNLCGTLILAPPGAGKTTLLRDLVRAVSDGEGAPPLRVGLADERGEVAAMCDGVPQMDVGGHTDVISGCPKAQGLSLLLRGMNPQVLAVDEVTAAEDVEAMAWAAGCGVKLLATAHGGGRGDLSARPLYRRLMELGIFQRLVLVDRDQGRRRWRAEVLP